MLPTTPPTVMIGVPTFRRPQMLFDLLESVGSCQIDGFSVVLVVMDNDNSESARRVVESFADSSRFEVRYLVEKERGIASCRNALLDEASRIRARYLVFIDDDEIVDSRWLCEIVQVAEFTATDAVCGNVKHLFGGDVQRWVVEADLLAFPTMTQETGEAMDCRSTANLLLRLRTVEELGIRFDSRFNLTGGSDTRFLELYSRSNAQIVAAPLAVSYERIDSNRANLSWFIRRSFRVGAAMSMKDSEGRRLAPAWQDFTKSTFLLLRSGVFLLPKTMKHGRAGAINQLWIASASVGSLYALLGGTYSAYKQTIGR